MSDTSNREINKLIAELYLAADQATEAARLLRVAMAELAEARKDPRQLVAEARRPPEPWRALNMN